MEERIYGMRELTTSILFYIFYIFYFMSLTYEMIFIYFMKTDYIIFFALLLTTLLSVLNTSLGYMYISFFFLFIISINDVQKFTFFIDDDEEKRIILLIRLFATVNFIVFYIMHMRYLLKEKNETSDRGRREDNESELHKRKRKGNNNLNYSDGETNSSIHNEYKLPKKEKKKCPVKIVGQCNNAIYAIPHKDIKNEENIYFSQPNAYNGNCLPSNHYINYPSNINATNNDNKINDFNSYNPNLYMNHNNVNLLNNPHNLHMYNPENPASLNEHYVKMEEYRIRKDANQSHNFIFPNKNIAPFQLQNNSQEKGI